MTVKGGGIRHVARAAELEAVSGAAGLLVKAGDVVMLRMIAADCNHDEPAEANRIRRLTGPGPGLLEREAWAARVPEGDREVLDSERRCRHPEDVEARPEGTQGLLSRDGTPGRTPWIAEARRPGRRRCAAGGCSADRLLGQRASAAGRFHRRLIGFGEAGLGLAGLPCVSYRYDEDNYESLRTVELIVRRRFRRSRTMSSRRPHLQEDEKT